MKPMDGDLNGYCSGRTTCTSHTPYARSTEFLKLCAYVLIGGARRSSELHDEL